MSRYIDADAVLTAIEEVFHRTDVEGEEQIGVLTCHRIVRTAPTADVVEVRHGEWKQVSEKYPRYVCTSCNHLFNNKEYKYCPNCGAKMDGGSSKNGKS